MSFQGFLVKKTIQQFPIRQKPLYYEDFTDQNLLLFINKKLADLRFQSGSNEISAKRMMNLRIKIPKDKSTEGPKVKRKPQVQSKSVKHEDDSNKKLHFKFKSPPVKPEVRLGSYFNDELLRQHQIGPLYQEYKLANLKANLVKLQAKKSYQLNELNHVELDDEEQVNYFLTEICRNHPEIDIGAMLHVDVDKKEQNFDDQEQKLKELIQKRIKQEEAEALMRLEQQYTKNLVSIYKETRYDQFEPEFKKQGQINMCKIKRQKEIQDRMFAEIFKTKQHSPLRNAKGHYLRNQKTPTHRATLSSPGLFISQPDSLQASDLKPSLLTTSYGSDSRLPQGNLSLKLKTIMDKCEELEGEQKRENEFFQRKLNIMGRELHTHFETARSRYKNADMEIDQNEGFDRFLQENKFKRKLINFQVSQVQNLHEVLSQRAKREITNNFMGTETERQKLF